MKTKLTLVLIFLLSVCVFMSSCRYINPFDVLWSDSRVMLGSTEDFYISESGEHILLQAVTPSGLAKQSITIPEFCSIEGQTYRITQFDYDALNGWKYLKEARIDNTSFVFGGDGFVNNTSLETIIIGENVPISNIIVKNYFLPYTDAPNIYLENSEIKELLVSKAIGGVDRHNIYFKNAIGEYELFSKAYYEIESNTTRIIQIIDIIMFVLALAIVLSYSVQFIKQKNNSLASKSNSSSLELKMLRNCGIITGVLYVLTGIAAKLLSLEFGPWIYGLHFLLPMTLMYFTRFEFLLSEKYSTNNFKKVVLTLLSIVTTIYTFVKYFLLGHYSLNTAIVIQGIIALALILVLVSKIMLKWYIALYCILVPLIVVGMALIDFALIGIVFAVGGIGLIVLILVVIAVGVRLISRGETITIYRN